jgi:hypothetical protein
VIDFKTSPLAVSTTTKNHTLDHYVEKRKGKVLNFKHEPKIKILRSVLHGVFGTLSPTITTTRFVDELMEKSALSVY